MDTRAALARTTFTVSTATATTTTSFTMTALTGVGAFTTALA
jgi:hypothetical protein